MSNGMAVGVGIGLVGWSFYTSGIESRAMLIMGSALLLALGIDLLAHLIWSRE